MYDADSTDFNTLFAHIRASLLNVYAIRLLPRMKSSGFLPPTFQIWSLEGKKLREIDIMVAACRDLAQRISCLSDTLDAEVRFVRFRCAGMEIADFLYYLS